MMYMIRHLQFIFHMAIFSYTLPPIYLSFIQILMPIMMFDLLDGIISQSDAAGNSIKQLGGLDFDAEAEDKIMSGYLPSLTQMGYESVNSLLNLKTVSVVICTYIIRMAISGFLKLIMKIGKKLSGKKQR